MIQIYLYEIVFRKYWYRDIFHGNSYSSMILQNKIYSWNQNLDEHNTELYIATLLLLVILIGLVNTRKMELISLYFRRFLRFIIKHTVWGNRRKITALKKKCTTVKSYLNILLNATNTMHSC